MISKEALIDRVLEWHLLEKEGKRTKADSAWQYIQEELSLVYTRANALEGVTIESLREALRDE